MRFAVAALAGVVVCGPAAIAEPVVYDNRDGTFRWLPLPIALFDGPMIPNEELDVTLPPTQDTLVDAFESLSPHGVKYLTQVWEGGQNEVITLQHRMVHGPNLRIALDRIMNIPDLAPHQIAIPRELAPGEVVGPDLNFQTMSMDLYFASDVSLAVPELLTVGEHGYVALELTLPTGVHYGWIELEARRDGDGAFERMAAVRWAWETTPGARLEVPAPGTGLLVAGVWAWAHGRRRRR